MNLDSPASRILLTVASLSVALLLSGASARGAETKTQEHVTASPQASPTPQAELPKPLVIPPAEHERKSPIPAVPEAIESGRSLFASQCAMCHGSKGDGRGDLAKSLSLKIPDFTNPAVQKRRSDGDYFFILTKGHGQMPGEGDRLHPQNKWEMILFIRTLAPQGVAKP